MKMNRKIRVKTRKIMAREPGHRAKGSAAPGPDSRQPLLIKTVSPADAAFLAGFRTLPEAKVYTLAERVGVPRGEVWREEKNILARFELVSIQFEREPADGTAPSDWIQENDTGDLYTGIETRAREVEK